MHTVLIFLNRAFKRSLQSSSNVYKVSGSRVAGLCVVDTHTHGESLTAVTLTAQTEKHFEGGRLKPLKWSVSIKEDGTICIGTFS